MGRRDELERAVATYDCLIRREVRRIAEVGATELAPGDMLRGDAVAPEAMVRATRGLRAWRAERARCLGELGRTRG